jgi:cyclopropane-fatty-acyl-phospholipid synthase
MFLVYGALEKNLLPDPLIRFGIRRLLKARLREELGGGEAAVAARQEALFQELLASPIAIETDAANAQHYEVPTEFFREVLGPHMKYSSGYWPEGCSDLAASELAMLGLSAERAELQDGQQILELGCGWGSMTLFMAERFPNARILGVSNSHSQRRHILAEAERRGLKNVEIETADINVFNPGGRRFDRVVSIEMFEHLRNYRLLLHRIASWMKPGGKLFVHIFCHHKVSYKFEARHENDWMSKYFFSGGLMPAADLLPRFHQDFKVERQWAVDGRHYQRTSEAWLSRMDERRETIWPIIRAAYGGHQTRRWWVYWRVFFMSCAELFGYAEGREWLVAHYLFSRSW